MNELFDKMNKLNRFGQREFPPSHGICVGIYSQIDDLVNRIDLEQADISQVREELFEVLDCLDGLNTQMTRERSAMWEVIDNTK